MIGLDLVHIGTQGAVKACAKARLLRAGMVQLGTPSLLRKPQNVPSHHGMFQMEDMQ
ncbi:hypothetical protein [Comamonas thiooxydans]|uniref:hypothetical protein n=1 Tax=Comamonas thiooxydans TaxID=363952 RepID=UPI002113B428|nr:hypothetical protein [Comamonas thiooxydans]UUE95086.1 hypothetical protein MJ608_05395 [Comamonas thiooxydans]